MIEAYTEEDIATLESLQASITSVKCLEDTKKMYPKATSIAYTRTGETEEKNVPFDDEMIHAIKGAGAGAYELLRNRGLSAEANDILLKEGHPQELNKLQKLKLRRFDNLIKKL